MNTSAPRRPPQTSPEPAWRGWLPGVRVVVRRRLRADADHLYTDLLGELTSVDDTGVSVATRQGTVHVPADEIALGKLVPPAPVRRSRRDPVTTDE